LIVVLIKANCLFLIHFAEDVAFSQLAG